jgi:hypothetical protein
MITVNSSDSRDGSNRYIDQDTFWTARGSNPNTFKRFLSPPNRPDRLWSQRSFLFSWYRGLKRPECEVNHSRPSSAKVKAWSPTCFPPYAFIVWKGEILLLRLQIIGNYMIEEYSVSWVYNIKSRLQ